MKKLLCCQLYLLIIILGDLFLQSGRLQRKKKHSKKFEQKFTNLGYKQMMVPK